MCLSGLLKFVNKLKVIFYELHPYEVPYKPRVSPDEVRKNFKAFDPLPSNIKSITDSSRSLLQELNTLRINTVLLKTREAKAVAELKHFLEHSFGNVYDFDYYSGNYQLKTMIMDKSTWDTDAKQRLCFTTKVWKSTDSFEKNALLFPHLPNSPPNTILKIR